MALNRLAKAVITVTMLTATAMGLSAAPATADGDHSGQPYVHVDNWWSDEGDLSTSNHTYTNVTCLWQKILWADGYLTNAGIDGIFGSGTATATRNWKRDNGLPADGVVGRNAFRAAGDRIFWDSAEGTYMYGGSVRVAWITIDNQGRFGFYEDGVHRLAGYNYRTCS